MNNQFYKLRPGHGLVVTRVSLHHWILTSGSLGDIFPHWVTIPLTHKRRLTNEVSAFLNSKKPLESKTPFVCSSDLPTSRPQTCFLHPWCLPCWCPTNKAPRNALLSVYISSHVCSLARYELAHGCRSHPPWQCLSEGVGT